MRNNNFKINRTDGGAAMLIAVIFFLFATMTIILGVASPILKQAAVSKNIITSKGSYYLAEASVEDILYRLKNGKQVATTENLSLNGGTVSTSVTDIAGGKLIVSNGNVTNLDRKVQATVVLGTGIAFHYGVQSGRGGFVLENSSSVTGNIHSSGSITGAGNIVRGDIVSSGATGLIDGVHATGTAFAHRINNSTIDRDAYYTTITDSNVGGNSYPGSPDQPDVDLPISDEQIEEWEGFAAAGGTVTCTSGTYTISSNTTIGPKKIPCDLLIKGSGIVVTINGPIWVTGNIDTQVSPTIKMASSLGNNNVAIIADNQSNRSGSGIISIGQNTVFQGSGSAGSFIFMISQNNSAETGGSINAINLGQGASAMVAYASHGQVTLEQSVSIKEVTAYKIILQNTANVVYDRGLPSVLFDSGPSGGYEVTDWREI